MHHVGAALSCVAVVCVCVCPTVCALTERMHQMFRLFKRMVCKQQPGPAGCRRLVHCVDGHAVHHALLCDLCSRLLCLLQQSPYVRCPAVQDVISAAQSCKPDDACAAQVCSPQNKEAWHVPGSGRRLTPQALQQTF